MFGQITDPDDSSITVQTANAMKIKNEKTYLRFTHAYNFYNVFIIFAVRTGKATMEYSDDNGATWKDTLGAAVEERADASTRTSRPSRPPGTATPVAGRPAGWTCRSSAASC